MKEVIKKYNVIGLYSFWCTECALVGTYFSKYSGTKHFSWISGQDAGSDNRYIKWIRPKAGELVAMSDFLAKEFYKNHAVLPAFIIPNGIDPGEFQVAVVKRDIDVCAAGSLIQLKQYDIFIEIINQLKSHIPGIRAEISGKGPEENQLRSRINQLQLQYNITLAGERPHPEVLRVMQRSRVFLHPSSYEGFSSVCMEALYAGAHVISFTDPGFGSIKHWHVVVSKEEMFNKALEILLAVDVDHQPVLAYSMDDSARAVMKLFVPTKP